MHVADSGERDSDPFTYLELGSKNKDELNINKIAVDNYLASKILRIVPLGVLWLNEGPKQSRIPVYIAQ